MAVPSHQKTSDALLREWLEIILNGADRRVSVQETRCGFREMQQGTSFEHPFLNLGSGPQTDGLCVFADSDVVVRSAENMTRFSARLGFDYNKTTVWAEEIEARVRLVFSVEVKGKELWRSQELDLRREESVDLPLPPETKEMVLKVRTAGGTAYAHGLWAGATVDLAGGERIKIGKKLYPEIPFSFVYDGHPSGELLSGWKKTRTSRPGKKKGVTEHILTWTDPKSALECRMELSEFADYPALEWVLYFRNGGKSDTAILENVQALDVSWKVQPREFENLEARVYRSRGSVFHLSDYEYVEERLLNTETIEMSAGGLGAPGGRSSTSWLPFFNTDVGYKGIITAIGWSGQWACRLDHSRAGNLRVAAGMEKTRLKLHPGEEIRTPRIMQLFWTEDRLAGHNLLRRFILDYHTPRIDGKPITGPFTTPHWGGMKTQAHLDRIAVYKREKLPFEYYWLDAGWYGHESTYSPSEFAGDWSKYVGDWRVNPRAHPQGLKPISDAAHAAGMKFLLWVEPTRAMRETAWRKEHPDWFLGEDEPLLLNLAKPEAQQGAIELLSGLIKEHGVDLYREDFNCDPLDYWKKNDEPDREGMTEIRYIEGVYAVWDALLERHPGLIIDNCSSGGRRIDLEVIGRSVVLWRSDYQGYPDHDPASAQIHGMGLSYWIPLHGTGVWASIVKKEAATTYRVRSAMGPACQLGFCPRESEPPQDDYPWDWFRKMCADYLRARPFFVGDYYPLTEPHACANGQPWAVYQMDRPDLDGGFVMAFRRKDGPWDKGTFRLRGLDEAATYEIEDADTGQKKNLGGKALLGAGIEIALSQPESSGLFFYRKV